MKLIAVKSRYEGTPVYVSGVVRVKRDSDGKWYESMWAGSLSRFHKIIHRIERKGREVKFTWFEGMGLHIDD